MWRYASLLTRIKPPGLSFQQLIRNEKFAANRVSLELASFRSASEPGPWYRRTERRAAGRKPLIRVALSLSAASVWRDTVAGHVCTGTPHTVRPSLLSCLHYTGLDEAATAIQPSRRLGENTCRPRPTAIPGLYFAAWPDWRVWPIPKKYPDPSPIPPPCCED